MHKSQNLIKQSNKMLFRPIKTLHLENVPGREMTFRRRQIQTLSRIHTCVLHNKKVSFRANQNMPQKTVEKQDGAFNS